MESTPTSKCSSRRFLAGRSTVFEFILCTDCSRFCYEVSTIKLQRSAERFLLKTGYSWHISVCQRKANERLEAQTFIHILESGLQVRETILLIMEQVFRSLKEQHPEITAAYFRQDNAGCYHSSCTILSARYCQRAVACR